MPSLSPAQFPPTWVVPAPLLRRTASPARPDYPQCYAFDPVTGDFAQDGGGHVRLNSGRAAATQAAAFLVTVQQADYPILSRQFGVDFRGLLARSLGHTVTEATLQDRMRRSARRDRRVRDLEDFTFTWAEGNRLTVRYTLVLADGTRVRQEQVLR